MSKIFQHRPAELRPFLIEEVLELPEVQKRIQKQISEELKKGSGDQEMSDADVKASIDSFFKSDKKAQS